jgi:hypothetical protein
MLKSEWEQLVQLLEQLSKLTEVPKAQHGGEFIVGGRGGIDNNLVAFRASRGERITVTPQGESGARSAPIINIYVHPGAKADRIAIRNELVPEILKALDRQYGLRLQ